MIIRNFLFHRVSDEEDRLWPPMPVTLFESLVAYISRQYQVISLEDYVLNKEYEKSGKGFATILFDDGYKDNIEYAIPVLQKYQCPASFYVVTDCIDKNIPTWTYIVDYLLQNTHAKSLTLDMDFVPAIFQKNVFAERSQRVEMGSRLKPWMKTLSNDQRRRILAHLQQSFSDVAVPGDKMMNWDELRQIQNAGYVIGSHSVSHPLLASIRDEEELFFELKESSGKIEKELKRHPSAISYPIGSYDERVIACSKKAGYKIGLAVKQKFYNTLKDDQFAIPRVELYNEPVWKCKLRIAGIYSWVKSKMPS